MDLLASLHIPTLVVAGFFVVLLCALLTLLSWRQHPHERILLYTGLMLLLSCPAIVASALRDVAPYWLAAIVGNVILLFNAGLAWQALRVFFGRQERWLITSLGAMAWLAISFVPGFLDNATLRIQVFSGVTILYMLAACVELITSRARCRFSIFPMLAILLMHAGLHIVRLAFDTPEAGLRELAHVPLIQVLVLEGLLYVVGTVTVSMMMVKDRAQQQLHEAAFTDALTGIDNRRAFNKRAASLLHQASGSNQSVTLLLCDLDHFKKINDQFGHAAGDQALVRFARILESVFSATDIYARIGGEEFACLLSCAPHQARVYAEQICQRCRQGVGLTPQTVSVGVATTEQVGYGLSSLMVAADEAMYQAKRTGRDQVRVYQVPERSAVC